MKIVVGGIIHERWTIDPYLEAMAKLAHPCEVVFAWVVDGSEELADQLAEHWWAPSAAVVNVTHLSGTRYTRQANEGEAIYQRMATLRNILRGLALDLGCDALFSVDSDIIVPSDVLTKLVATGKPWVAPLVRNDAEGGNPRGHWNVFKLRGIERDAGLCDHFRPIGPGFPKEDMIGWDPRDQKKEQCLAAGAVCLYGRELLEKARWRTDSRGRQEDIGFSIDAFKAGYRAWYIPVQCRHLTVDGLEEA